MDCSSNCDCVSDASKKKAMGAINKNSKVVRT